MNVKLVNIPRDKPWFGTGYFTYVWVFWFT